MADVLLQNAQLLSGEKVNVWLENGFIESITPYLATNGVSGSNKKLSGSNKDVSAVYDLAGRVLVSGFVDSHVHLDKTLSMNEAGVENASGTLLEAIERWHAVKPHLTHQSYVQRATTALNLALSHGTTAMRTHVDIDAEHGLLALEAILEVKEAFQDKMFLQVVALGHVGVEPKQTQMMAAALAAGADFVGGAPALAPDPASVVKASLDLAERYNKPIDLHIDETDDPTMATLEVLAQETLARGLQGHVSAGHCVSLMAMEQERAQTVIDKVAKAQLNIVSLPAVNLVLQGRSDSKAVRRGVTRIKELLKASVNVSVASDNVQDPFNPFGNYDLLWLANLTGHVAHLTGVQEREHIWHLVSQNPAKTLGLNYGVKIGNLADLVILDSTDAKSTLATMPSKKAVLKAGKVVYGSL